MSAEQSVKAQWPEAGLCRVWWARAELGEALLELPPDDWLVHAQSVHSWEYGKILGSGPSPEAAWRNAAENLKEGTK